MNRVLIVGGGSGLGVARMLLEAAKVGCGAPVVIVDGTGDSESVLVRDEDGTTRVGTLNTDELQMLCALRGQPTFANQLTLRATRDFTLAEEGLVPQTNWETNAERRDDWLQSHAAHNRKFQSMQAKARRR